MSGPVEGAAARPRGRVLALWRELPKLRTLLVLVSGLSMLPLLARVALPYGVLVAGAVFGALVLVPFIEAPRARLLRALALVAGAALIHWGSVRLGASLDQHLQGGYGAAAVICGVPGLTGALLCALLTALVAPLRPVWTVVAVTSVAGFFGAQAFFFALPLGGYLLWQLLVFLALYASARGQTFAREADTAPAPAAAAQQTTGINP